MTNEALYVSEYDAEGRRITVTYGQNANNTHPWIEEEAT